MKDNDYIDFGIVFRIDDLDSDGVFYIGETTSKVKWLEKYYLGTGSGRWNNYKKKHPPINRHPNNPNAHHYKRTILRSGFTSKEKLYKAELEEILKYAEWNEEENKYVINNPKCMNVRTCKQGVKPEDTRVCGECGGLKGCHRSYCSKYKEIICEICGGKKGNHKEHCKKYDNNSTCPECGGIRGNHKNFCSLYVSKKINTKPCEECNGVGGAHYSWCSKFKRTNMICPECGGLDAKHKKYCSKFKQIKDCTECGGIDGKHRKGCSKFKQSICSECGGKGGHHYKTCSKSLKCEYCGNALSSNRHKSWCPILFN